MIERSEAAWSLAFQHLAVVIALARHVQLLDRMLRQWISALRENLGRAIVISIVVGSTLIYINHGDHLAQEPVCDRFFLKCGLTYLVPFLVSMVSVVLARRQLRRRRNRPG